MDNVVETSQQELLQELIEYKRDREKKDKMMAVSMVAMAICIVMLVLVLAVKALPLANHAEKLMNEVEPIKDKVSAILETVNPEDVNQIITTAKSIKQEDIESIKSVLNGVNSLLSIFAK